MTQHIVSLSLASEQRAPQVLSAKHWDTLCFTAVAGVVPRALRLLRAKHDPVVIGVHKSVSDARWTAEISVVKLPFDPPVTEWKVELLYPAEPSDARTERAMYRSTETDEVWMSVATVKLVRPSHLTLHLVSTVLAATGLLALVPLLRVRTQLSSGLKTALLAMLMAALYSLTVGLKLRRSVLVSRLRSIAFALPVCVVAVGWWLVATQAVTVRNAVHHGEVMDRFGTESYWLIPELATQRREFLEPKFLRLIALSTVEACAPVSRSSAVTSKVWVIDCVAPWQRMNADMREMMDIPHPGEGVRAECVDRLPAGCAARSSPHDPRSMRAIAQLPVESGLRNPSRYDGGHWLPSVSGQLMIGANEGHILTSGSPELVEEVQVSVWGNPELREVSLHEPQTTTQRAIWNVDRTHRPRTRTQFKLQFFRSASPVQFSLVFTGQSPISVQCPASEHPNDRLVLDVITTHEAALVVRVANEFSVHV